MFHGGLWGHTHYVEALLVGRLWMMNVPVQNAKGYGKEYCPIRPGHFEPLGLHYTTLLLQ